MKNSGLVLATTLAVLLGGCAPRPEAAAVSSQQEIDATRQLHDAVVRAMNASDVDELVGLFAPDAVVMADHDAVVTGAEAIRKLYQDTFAAYSMVIEFTPQEVKVFGDRALDRGIYKYRLTPKAGGAVIADEGKYLTLLQRQPDRSWKITHDIGSTSLP